MLDIKCGVPKGSILGPLILITYINDFLLTTSIIDIIMYADNTNLFYLHQDMKDLFSFVNSELASICN